MAARDKSEEVLGYFSSYLLCSVEFVQREFRYATRLNKSARLRQVSTYKSCHVLIRNTKLQGAGVYWWILDITTIYAVRILLRNHL